MRMEEKARIGWKISWRVFLSRMGHFLDWNMWRIRFAKLQFSFILIK